MIYPLDFTQFYSFHQCPMLWWETYVNGYRKAPASYHRDDALCIGSLYHSGMENMLRTGQPTIDEEVIADNTPKPEALSMVHQMLTEYAVWAGREDWEVITIEEPLEFEIETSAGIAHCMAKLDASVRINNECWINNGISGQSILITPGLYTYEHKTKASSGNRANFLRRWELDAQPIFQQFGLRQHATKHNLSGVAGTIINVAEKPDLYIPVRTCKGCNTKQDFSSYGISGGQYVCRLCGHSNEFAAPTKSSQLSATTFYRIKLPLHEVDSVLVQIWAESVVHTYQQMSLMRQHGPTAIADPYLGMTRCIHPQFGACHFVDSHTGLASTADLSGLIQVDTTKYMKDTTKTI